MTLQDFEHLTKTYIVRLPRNCQASHVYRDVATDDDVLAIKLLIEQRTCTFSTKNSLYEGLLVLWITSLRKFVIVHTQEQFPIKIRTSTLLRSHDHRMHDFDNFLCQMQQACVRYNKQKYNEVLSCTKHVHIPRDLQLERRPSTAVLETAAHDEIQAILRDGILRETREKCRADAGYIPHASENTTNYLPIQTKSATIRSSGQMNIFHSTSGYEDMILLCRPMTRLYVGTLVLPGHLAPDNITFPLNNVKSMYLPYVVSDVDLSHFMCTLYEAVACRKTYVTWPSGAKGDITPIQLHDFGTLCTPAYKSDLTEWESAQWRENTFTGLTYRYPRVQATTVDIIINGVTIQDKHATTRNNPHRFVANFHKNAGRQTKQRSPYHYHDFQALWVNLPKKRRFVFIIPAKVLLEHGIFKTDTCAGKMSVTCYTPGYICDHSNGRTPDTWTQQYCIDTESENAENLIRDVLASCSQD